MLFSSVNLVDFIHRRKGSARDGIIIPPEPISGQVHSEGGTAFDCDMWCGRCLACLTHQRLEFDAQSDLVATATLDPNPGLVCLFCQSGPLSSLEASRRAMALVAMRDTGTRLLG